MFASAGKIALVESVFDVFAVDQGTDEELGLTLFGINTANATNPSFVIGSVFPISYKGNVIESMCHGEAGPFQYRFEINGTHAQSLFSVLRFDGGPTLLSSAAFHQQNAPNTSWGWFGQPDNTAIWDGTGVQKVIIYD